MILSLEYFLWCEVQSLAEMKIELFFSCVRRLRSWCYWKMNGYLCTNVVGFISLFPECSSPHDEHQPPGKTLFEPVNFLFSFRTTFVYKIKLQNFIRTSQFKLSFRGLFWYPNLKQYNFFNTRFSMMLRIFSIIRIFLCPSH